MGSNVTDMFTPTSLYCFALDHLQTSPLTNYERTTSYASPAINSTSGRLPAIMRAITVFGVLFAATTARASSYETYDSDGLKKQCFLSTDFAHKADPG
ncbi:hypothetical protein B0A48_17009 [Cryoendolithus antarcticus]|uniref:Uncharacterized protein n=1 Tax=Cryoendolithus antarcticus TaxID=1507870 RepID=A0A1V8SC00_9PEZI|nr:hypothetical protein B0A48_17009 [Cryoendolithus antarcticus]